MIQVVNHTLQEQLAPAPWYLIAWYEPEGVLNLCVRPLKVVRTFFREGKGRCKYAAAMLYPHARRHNAKRRGQRQAVSMMWGSEVRGDGWWRDAVALDEYHQRRAVAHAADQQLR